MHKLSAMNPERQSWGSILNGFIVGDGTSKSNRCSVRLLDTIVSVNGGPKWYFTTKSGTISKKKSDTVTADNIVDRFSRFALANPQNSKKIVGVLYDGQNRILTTEDDLKSILARNNMGLEGPESFLQVYLRPLNGKHITYLTNAKRKDDGCIVFRFARKNENGTHDPTLAYSVTGESVESQMTNFSQNVLNFLNDEKGLIADDVTLEYIVDDNGHIWLSSMPTILCCKRIQSDEKVPLNFTTSKPSDIKSDSQFPSLGTDVVDKTRPNSSASGRGSSRGSFDGSVSNNLIFKDGAAFCCQLGPDDLPGLRGWTLVSAASTEAGLDTLGGKDPVWAVDVDQYHSSSASPNPAMAQVRQRRAAARQVVKGQLIHFIKRAEPLLLGDVDCDTSEEFVEAWKRAHTEALEESKSKHRDLNAEVVACGNTHAVCLKLESLIQAGFRNSPLRAPAQVPHLERPQSDPSLRRVLSPSSEVNSTPRSTDDLGHDLRRRVQMPEDNIGPSRPLLQQEAFVQNQTQQAQQSKEKNPSLSQPTASTKVESKAMPNAKAKQVKSIYGDMAGGSGNSKAATKKKGASGQGTAGKRSSMDEPPSIDMIAKFAAEKEKIQQHERNIEGHDNRIGVEEGDGDFDGDLDMWAQGLQYSSQEFLSQGNSNFSGTNGAGVGAARSLKGKPYPQVGGTNGPLLGASKGTNGPLLGASKGKGKTKQAAARVNDGAVAAPEGGDSIIEAERRLADLEKIAQQNSAALMQHRHLQHQFRQQQLLQQAMKASANLQSYQYGGVPFPMVNTPIPYQPFGSVGSTTPGLGLGGMGGSVVSASEADFMVRQVATAGVGGLTDIGLSIGEHAMDHDSMSLRGGHGAHGGHGNLGTHSVGSAIDVPGMPPSSNITDKLTEALQTRVVNLEKQVVSLNSTIERKDKELGKMGDKLKRSIMEKDEIKKASAQELRAKDEECQQQFLNLRQQHAREMSFIATAGSSHGDPSSPGPTGAAKKSESAFEANKKLVEQLEVLRNEQERMQRRHFDDRKALQVEADTKLMNTERALKAEILSLKVKNTDLEDRITAKEDEIATAQSRMANLTTICEQLEKARAEAMEGQGKLRADLKNMQQSVNASYRLESAQALQVGMDADTAIKLNEAKADARVRQLSNKVEFLKSQVEAEAAAAEEMKKAADVARSKLEELREEFRFRMREAEQQRQGAVEDAERRVEAVYEERMLELTTLQAKMMHLQGQLQETTQEALITRQREEAAKTASAKAQAQASTLRAEIEQLRNQVVELREERDRDTIQESTKQSQDSAMRRLDNERQYLKSQLASEITHKNELQKALTQCQMQLGEAQRQWGVDVQTLKDTLASNEGHAILTEQRLKQTNAQLEADMNRFQGQNKDLKEAFTKMRDQLRMEQIAIENSNAANKRLLEQLEELNTELARVKLTNEQNSIIHKEQIAALHATMNDNESTRLTEINRLKDEISKQYSAVAMAERGTLGAHKEFESKRELIERDHARAQALLSLTKWRKNALGQAFRLWSTNSTLIAVAASFREQLNGLVRETLEEARQDKEAALDEQKQALKMAHEVEIEDVRDQCIDDIAAVKAKALEEKEAALEAAHVEFENHLREKVAEMSAMDAQLRRECQEEIDRNNAMKKLEISDAVQKGEMYLDRALEDEKMHIEEAKAKTIKDEEVKWKQILLERENELTTSYQQDFMAMKTSLEEQMKTQLKTHKEQLRTALASADALRVKHLEDAEAEHAEEIVRVRREEEALRAQHREEMLAQTHLTVSRHKEDLTAAHEDRVRDIRQEWDDELNRLLKDKDADCEVLLKKKMEEHCIAVEGERVRGIKLEASKWRQAMKEAEKRFELDNSRARAEARAERDAEAKVELQQQATEFERRAVVAAAKAKEEFDEMVQDYEVKLSTQKNALEVAKDEAVKVAEATTRRQLIDEWQDKLKKAVDEAWSDSATMWQSKLEAEQNRLESFKRDVSAQTQRVAQERNALQEKVDRADEVSRLVEEEHQLRLAQLQHEVEEQRANVTNHMKGEMQKALDKQKMEHDLVIEGVEGKYKEMMDMHVRATRAALEDDMDRNVAQLQEESDRLISGLEKAMLDLRKEKVGLTDQLEAITTKLENSEDALFDLQQEVKKKDKAHSLVVWQMMAGVQRMKINFKRGMDDFDKENKESHERMKRKLSRRTNEMTLAAMKLTALINEVEEARKRLHGVLASHKAELLVDKRTRIRQLEKEIERVASERDSLEEQRDQIEESIEDMEGQVRELEEQIREHNRNSSMQNGRINVAHARKKKRLDAELERLLDNIEQRRSNMGDLDDRVADKARQRDEKEGQMIDLEKELVQILMEQQRLVLALVEESRTADEKGKLIAQVAQLPWPPYVDPSMNDAVLFNSKVVDDGDEDG